MTNQSSDRRADESCLRLHSFHEFSAKSCVLLLQVKSYFVFSSYLNFL